MMTLKNLLLLLLLIFILQFRVLGMNKNQDKINYCISHLADTTDTTESEESPKHRSVKVSLKYKTNTNYRGRYNDSIKQPSVYSTISYRSKTSFSISLIPTILFNSDSTGTGNTRELDISAGYDFKIVKSLEGGLYYSRYWTEKTTTTLKSAFSNDVIADINLDWWLYSDVSASYSFGTSKDFFLSFSNSYSFDFDSIFAKDASVSIAPELDINWGTQDYYNTFLKKQLTKKGRVITKENTVSNTKFTLSGITLALPLDYFIGNFTISIAGYFTKPLNQPKTSQTPAYGYMETGISYVFK